MGELSEQDKVKEEIRFAIEKLRLSFIGLLTVAGATISLVIDYGAAGAKIFFISVGFLLSVATIAAGYRFYKTIKQLLK